MSKKELVEELIHVFDYAPEWVYDDFNQRWIELTKKEPEIDFNSPEWTEIKL